MVVAITPSSVEKAAKNQREADLRASTGLDEVPHPIASRVMRYAATLGLVAHDTRHFRAEPTPGAWYTRPGLGHLATAAEVVAGHLRREREDSCDLDAFALLRLARRWRRWGASAPSARARRGRCVESSATMQEAA